MIKVLLSGCFFCALNLFAERIPEPYRGVMLRPYAGGYPSYGTVPAPGSYTGPVQVPYTGNVYYNYSTGQYSYDPPSATGGYLYDYSTGRYSYQAPYVFPNTQNYQRPYASSNVTNQTINNNYITNNYNNYTIQNNTAPVNVGSGNQSVNTYNSQQNYSNNYQLQNNVGSNSGGMNPTRSSSSRGSGSKEFECHATCTQTPTYDRVVRRMVTASSDAEAESLARSIFAGECSNGAFDRLRCIFIRNN